MSSESKSLISFGSDGLGASPETILPLGSINRYLGIEFITNALYFSSTLMLKSPISLKPNIVLINVVLCF
jgi:hypothetical protein